MIARRRLLSELLLLALPQTAWAFGEEGAFHPRLLQVERTSNPSGVELLLSAASRWSFELIERTSAPARISSEVVSPEAATFLLEPFVFWVGDADPGELSPLAQRRLTEFFRLGGQMVVDDRQPGTSAFVKGAARELAKILPDLAKAPLPPGHVLFKSFYLIERPHGRVLGPPTLDALVASNVVRVLFLEHDLLGALARQANNWAYPVEPGGSLQRELAIRFAINIAMHFLCTDYKDDQVHAPFLMRRRARGE
jgi:hypothetical protein